MAIRRKVISLEPPHCVAVSLLNASIPMAQRDGAKYLMLTHLASSLGAVLHNRWKVPGGALTEADYRKAVESSGYTGVTIVGADLVSLRLPVR